MRTGLKHFADILQRDSADSEPWPIDVLGRPAHIIKRNPGTPGLRGRREYRAHGKLGCLRFHRALGLCGSVRAEAEGGLMGDGWGFVA